MVQLEKLPPHDIFAEESVIGSILIDGHALSVVMGFLKPEDFYRERNRLIYEAASDISSRGEPVNQVTITHELERRGTLERVGGSAYLSNTISVVPTSVHVEHYGRLVQQTATMRRIIAASHQIAEIGYENDPEVAQALSKAEDILFSIRSGYESRDFFHIRESLTSFLEEQPIDGSSYKRPLESHFADLDRLLGGFHPSDMVVLAARPSIGKSMLALNVALNIALENRSVAIFSLEMGREQVAMRLLAAQASINMHSIRLSNLTENEEARIVDSIGLLSDKAIYIDDSPLQTVGEMRGKARRLQMEHGVDFVVIDYMQLIDGPRNRRDNNRAQEVSEISRQIKAMARELEVPVLAVSQLSRAVTHRQSQRPVLSDLRESGSIEQDADVVIFIHRIDKSISEEEWNRSGKNEPYPRNLAELIIAKHRHGPVGEIWMAVRDDIGRFRSGQGKGVNIPHKPILVTEG